MSVDDSTRTDAGARVGGSARARVRARELARRAMWRFAPSYARHRVRRASERERVERLENELERVRERHTEQIDRLEDLARELVLSVASLQRGLSRREPPEGD